MTLSKQEQKAVDGLTSFMAMLGAQDFDVNGLINGSGVDGLKIFRSMLEAMDPDGIISDLFEPLFEKAEYETFVDRFFDDIMNSSIEQYETGADASAHVGQVVINQLRLAEESGHLEIPEDKRVEIYQAVTDAVSSAQEQGLGLNQITGRIEAAVRNKGGVVHEDPELRADVAASPTDQPAVSAPPPQGDVGANGVTTDPGAVDYTITDAELAQLNESFNLEVGAEVAVTNPEFGEENITAYAFTASGTLVETGYEVSSTMFEQGGTVQTLSVDGMNVALHFEPKGSNEGYIIPIDNESSFKIDPDMAAKLSQAPAPAPIAPAPMGPVVSMDNNNVMNLNPRIGGQ